MIEDVIYDKPAVMGLVSPFSNIYMIVGEEAVMLIHETLYWHCISVGTLKDYISYLLPT